MAETNSSGIARDGAATEEQLKATRESGPQPVDYENPDGDPSVFANGPGVRDEDGDDDTRG